MLYVGFLAALTAVVVLGLLWAIQGCPSAYADPPDDNGWVDAVNVDDPPIVVDAGWSATTQAPPAFFWSGPPGVFNWEGPFTFTSLTTVIVRVTDDFCKGDQFRIYDLGVPIGDTSAVAIGTCTEVGPDAAFADPTYSSGSFPLGPGSHSIGIQVIVNPFGGGRGYIRVDSVVIEVEIDIKPGSDPNCINPNGHGVIPVAILTTTDFDAATVDPFTVQLEGSAVRVKGKSGKAGSLEDVDGDGDLDLVVQIVDDSSLAGNSSATLTGFLLPEFGGTSIEGTDSICIVP
jgi:hypothetical protein